MVLHKALHKFPPFLEDSFVKFWVMFDYAVWRETLYQKVLRKPCNGLVSHWHPLIIKQINWQFIFESDILVFLVKVLESLYFPWTRWTSTKRKKRPSLSRTRIHSSISFSPLLACTPQCFSQGGQPLWERAGSWSTWGGPLSGSVSLQDGQPQGCSSGPWLLLSSYQIGSSEVLINGCSRHF